MVRIREEQVYPVASPLGLEIPTPEAVEEALASSDEKASLYFMLGNLRLIAEEFQLAAESFEQALEQSEPNAKLYCNLGVAYKLLGRLEDAKRQFEQSVLIDSKATLPQMHLGKLQLQSSDFQGAKQSFERVLVEDPAHVEALTELAYVFEAQNEQEEALLCFEKAYKLDSGAYRARNRLGRDYFHRGKKLFEKEQYTEAFATWARGEHLYPLSFSSDQIVSREMAELVDSFSKGEVFEELLESSKGQIAKQTASRELYYDMFSKFFFKLGLQPEVFEDLDALEGSYKRWEESILERGEHPYPHYRFALIHCYRGELEPALDELLYCEDNLPRAKQVSLKISGILPMVKQLYRLQMTEDGLEPGSQPVEQWNMAGFEDPFQIRAWSRTGAPPTEAREWKDLKFTPDSARAWRKLRLHPSEAEKWRDAGFRASGDVRLWSLASVSPDVAKQWSEHFRHDVSLAIQSLNSEITDPHEANEWLSVFQFPSEAAKWKELNFTPEEARDLLAEGISDPFVAQKMRD